MLHTGLAPVRDLPDANVQSGKSARSPHGVGGAVAQQVEHRMACGSHNPRSRLLQSGVTRQGMGRVGRGQVSRQHWGLRTVRGVQQPHRSTPELSALAGVVQQGPASAPH
ncbi:hypothetical protein ACOMHN_046122 [Nucella lapillus]